MEPIRLNHLLTLLLLQLMKPIVLILIFLFIGQTMLAQEAMKMVKVKGQPIIVGNLNGKKAYFLVDTGSDVTFLNLKDAYRYKFKYAKTVIPGYQLSGLTSRHGEEMLEAYNVDLYLGRRKIEAKYRVFDLTNIIESIGASTGVWINGIIGSDVMRRYKFFIDYEANEIRFSF